MKGRAPRDALQLNFAVRNDASAFIHDQPRKLVEPTRSKCRRAKSSLFMIRQESLLTNRTLRSM
jgi:hypothetical protein